MKARGPMRSRQSSADLPAEVARLSPAGLSVERLRLGSEEFAVFSWDVATPPAAPDLTPAEQEVLRLVGEGASNQAIARARATSVRTVANQVASLLRKLGASSRFELIRRHGAAHGARRKKA
jgi:DNA-binding NarL/FixJ family response regulator